VAKLRDRCGSRPALRTPQSALKYNIMSLTREFSIFGWTIGVSLSTDCLMIGLAWEVAPVSFYLSLPFFRLSLERNESDHLDDSWRWGWSLARLTVLKTEFRLDLDLNIWAIGLSCPALDDFAVHLGPLNIQIETDKGYAGNFPLGVPVLRVLFLRGVSIRSWPPQCRCCPPRDRLQCDDMTDFDHPR
jgi:hypothetical protein